MIAIAALILASVACSNETSMQGSMRSRATAVLEVANSYSNVADGSLQNPSTENNQVSIPNYSNDTDAGIIPSLGNDSDGNVGRPPGNDTDGNVGRPPANDSDGNVGRPPSSNPNDSRIMVGFNYEDTPGHDQDHNDGVVCIEGNYRVDSANGIITSLIDQRANIQLYDGGWRINTILIRKYLGSPANPSGIQTVTNFSGNRRYSKADRVSYDFKAGDRIAIDYNRGESNIFAALPTNGNRSLIKIEIDRCRNSGN